MEQDQKKVQDEKEPLQKTSNGEITLKMSKVPKRSKLMDRIFATVELKLLGLTMEVVLEFLGRCRRKVFKKMLIEEQK